MRRSISVSTRDCRLRNTHQSLGLEDLYLRNLRPLNAKSRSQARERLQADYFGGAGVNTSTLRPGSGFGFGFGAFFVSFLPLSLFPMAASVTQFSGH